MKNFILLTILLFSQALIASEIFVYATQIDELEDLFNREKISSTKLTEMQYSDVHRALRSTPGLYLQEEDGFGLRPNIGMRGTSPKRSKKISIYEDGVLMAPAPYSDPAAYFFPNILRTEDINVYKGASTLRFGPNSIGGALNFKTRALSNKNKFQAKLTYGLIKKYSLLANVASTSRLKSLVEYNGNSSDGFKELSNGQPSGFTKHDVLLKSQWTLLKKAKITHDLKLKLSYSNEKSHESYLGLTPDDFDYKPYQKYLGAQKDLMTWTQKQASLSYNIDSKNKFSSKLYIHEFDRSWDKFKGFHKQGLSLEQLTNPSHSEFKPHLLSVLKGVSNSTSTAATDFNDQLLLKETARVYRSMGWTNQYSRGFAASKNSYLETEVGYRLHYDSVQNDQKTRAYLMKDQFLVASSDIAQKQNSISEAHSLAHTFYTQNLLTHLDRYLFGVGLRFENVSTSKEKIGSSQSVQTQNRSYFVPAFMTKYLIAEETDLFLGMNRGIGIIGPGQSEDIQPERSWNFEFGGHTSFNQIKLSSTVYSNFYSNIKGICSQSSGCSSDNLGQEFNGGKAFVYGVESSISTKRMVSEVEVSASLSHTFTSAKFSEDLVSDNEEWGLGLIKKSSPLPYIPRHQVNLQVGGGTLKLKQYLNLFYQSKVFDQSTREGRREVPGHLVVDTRTQYDFNKNLSLFLKADNIFGSKYIVSLRPGGLRVGKPRMLSVGLSYQI